MLSIFRLFRIFNHKSAYHRQLFCILASLNLVCLCGIECVESSIPHFLFGFHYSTTFPIISPAFTRRWSAAQFTDTGSLLTFFTNRSSSVILTVIRSSHSLSVHTYRSSAHLLLSYTFLILILSTKWNILRRLLSLFRFIVPSIHSSCNAQAGSFFFLRSFLTLPFFLLFFLTHPHFSTCPHSSFIPSFSGSTFQECKHRSNVTPTTTLACTLQLLISLLGCSLLQGG